MKNLLVVGATGLLGKATIKYFKTKKNWRCAGLSRRPHKIRNVEYSTFLTIAQGIDYAEKVKEGIDAAIDIAKDIYGITALQNFLYDEAEQYSTNFDLYLVRAFGGKCNVTTDRKNTKFNEIEKGVTKEFRDMNLSAREAWAFITCDQKNVKYSINPK